MHTFFNPNAPFPTWQQFLARPDNKGLNVMQAKQKYLTEQSNYYRMIPPTPSFASAAGGAGSTSTDTGPVLLLDQYPSSTSVYGYSLRKLTNTYSGAAIRVRRDNDDAELDIGFSNNELDTDALTNFVGSNNGYVTTWYDQGGNEHNLTQSTADDQPLIVSSGTVRTTDDKPSLYFDQARRDKLISTRINALHNGTKCFVAVLVKSNYNTTGRQNIIATLNDLSSNIGYTLQFITSNDEVRSRVRNGTAFVSNNITAGDYPENNRYLITDILDVNNATAANRSTLNVNNGSNINNNTDTATASTANSSRGIMVGGMTSDSFFRGDMQEIIIYTTDESNNKSGITDNINTYYSIY